MRKWIDALWVATFCALALATAAAVFSCQTQTRQPRAGARAEDRAPAQSRATPTTAPVATEADVPIGKITAQVARDMGFSYDPAPSVKASGGRDIAAMDAACVHCHTATDAYSMHKATSVSLACVDCHGGGVWNGRPVTIPADVDRDHPDYDKWKARAHVEPKVKDLWKSAANPEVPEGRTLNESADFIRFVNPGDLRAAYVACGNCHEFDGDDDPDNDERIVSRVEKSMMAHGAMLWGAALYNNGAINRKTPLFGESYALDGEPRAIRQNPPPTTQQMAERGILSILWPLPRWEISQPGNILRVFERGGKIRPPVGVPDKFEEAGKPDVKLSLRGFGTDVRTDPVFIGLQKTRLLDPTINLFGTNDHPGDYRGSGCSACHVVYANDRSPVHSGRQWANFGNRGESFSKDPTVNPGRAPATTGPTEPYENAADPSRPPREGGHPIRHVFEKSVPTSSCIVCHVHPGTNVVNAYLGFTWWDNETDGEFMYPKRQKYPTPAQEARVNAHNPEGAAPRGLWSNLYPNDKSHAGQVAGKDFLENLWNVTNPNLKRTQFADFHGHGWVYRAVFKQDAHGRLLDVNNKPVENVTVAKMKDAIEFTRTPETTDDEVREKRKDVPVHLKDIHLEMGMHCVDCHFEQDNHGDGNLYGETRNAVMIDCIDCHGTQTEPAKILTYLKKDAEGDASDEEMAALRKAFFSGNAWSGDAERFKLDRYFELNDDGLVQISRLDSNVKWTVKQTSAEGSPAAERAHWIRRDNQTFSNPNPKKSDDDGEEDKEEGEEDEDKQAQARPTAVGDNSPAMQLAHSNESMACYACHTSWNTSCFGCHLPMRANAAKPMLHNEGLLTRNYTNYNFQTLRDDVYMLGKDSSVKGGKVVPIRSACAVLVSSQDANRQWLYQQQQTISAEGYAGTAFSPYFPHTVRTAETKQCADCHLSERGDNNALLAQLTLQGTNSVNFIGRFAWIGMDDHGLEAVAVTERDEPQAVIGSRLHELAFPDYFKQHVARGRKLAEAFEHHGHVLDVQLRGEYVYAACGEKGFIAYDIANIDNKGFSERIVTAPVSPLGQRFYVKTKYATSVCSPSTMAIDPTRKRLPENEEGRVVTTVNGKRVEEVKDIHPLYAFIYVTDKYEGLVVVGNRKDGRNRLGVATLLDGDPENNFLSKALSFNPGGQLKGARHMALHGHYAYVACDAGIVVVDLNDPLNPQIVSGARISGLNKPRKITFQFRYGFVCDDDGLKVIDVTDPRAPRLVSGATVPINDARDVYVARTYGYVAAGREGLVIVDLTTPEKPRRVTSFTDGGMDDATAVRVGMTNSSLFAYVADGRNGLKVVQLTSADDPGYLGFSPVPRPRLIASKKTPGPAITISEGLDRDRAVDESGNQLAVFGRKGARPFTHEEMRRLFINAQTGRPYYVANEPPAAAPRE